MTPFIEATVIATEEDTYAKLVAAGVLPTDALKAARRRGQIQERVWKNDLYTVFVDQHAPHGFGDEVVVWELSIKRNDKEPIHDWRHLLAIKNELCGQEVEAFELYPAESRVMDTANQYYLYAIMAPVGFRFPVGFTLGKRATPEEAERFGAKQRPFTEEN